MFKKIITSITFAFASILPISCASNISPHPVRIDSKKTVINFSLKTSKEKEAFRQHRHNRDVQIKQQYDDLNNATDKITAAKAIIERYAGQRADTNFKVINKYTDPDNNWKYDVYSYEVSNHILTIEGSSVVAMTHGWYEWLKSQEFGMVDWEDERIDIPSSLPDIQKTVVTSPYEKHILGNQAAVSYSQTWWDKYKWMDFSSWAALHGYDLIFDLIGREKIYADLWRSEGFDDEFIKNYESGPSYSPFQQIGCVHNIHSNPYFFKFANKRAELNHNILGMFKKLDITPIAPGFSGFVPKEIKAKSGYENISLYETSWSGIDNYIINPEDSKLRYLTKKYTELYEKEYGPQQFYESDAFDEITLKGMDKPQVKKFVNNFGNSIFKGIEDATKNHSEGSSVWVMQGWALGYLRFTTDYWDYELYHNLVKDIPDDKFLLMDPAVDFNFNYWNNIYGVSDPNYIYYMDKANPDAVIYDGKMWSYSSMPVSGGNNGINGDIKWYASAGPDVLKMKNKGRLFAYGNSSEGIDSSTEIQELMSDMGWRDKVIDFDEWIENYTFNRYGFWNDDLKEYWRLRTLGSNSKQEDHTQYMLQTYPKMMEHVIWYDETAQAMHLFGKIAQEQDSNAASWLFKDDLLFNAAFFEAMNIDEALKKVRTYSTKSRLEWGKKLSNEYMTRIDKILSNHSTFRLDKWIKWSRLWGDTTEEQRYYEEDAKMLITWWKDSGLNNYASKLWGGLVGDYYLHKINFVLDKAINREYNKDSENENILFPWLENPREEAQMTPTPFVNEYNVAVNMLLKQPIDLSNIPGIEKPGRLGVILTSSFAVIIFIGILIIRSKKNVK